MEANTSHTPAVAGRQADGRPGLWSRVAVLVSPKRRNGEVSNRRAVDEATARLDHYLRDSKAVVLHHRSLPGKAGEVSHLIVAPGGITVVDSRNYTSGRARLSQRRLRVGMRDRSDLVRRIHAHTVVVRELLADTPYTEVPVEAALAWREVEGLPLLHTFNGPRVMVCGVRKIAREAARPGPISKRRVAALAAYLDQELPPV